MIQRSIAALVLALVLASTAEAAASDAEAHAAPGGGSRAEGAADSLEAQVVPESVAVFQALGDELAAQVARFRRRKSASVTHVSRRAFRIDLGRDDGVRESLDADVLRYTESGVFAVARAAVVEVDKGFSRLRRSDRGRNLRIRAGDAVLLYVPLDAVLTGGIGGVPPAVSEAMVFHLASALRDKHGFTVKTESRLRPLGPWPWKEASELSRDAAQAGLACALAGWADIDGDSLHVVLGLIDASNQQTLELYSVSSRIDPALEALIGREPSVAAEPVLGESGIEVGSPYETGLAPAFEFAVPARVPAVHIIDAQRALCVVGENSVELYRVGASGAGPVKVAQKAIESPPQPVQCRDAAGETAYVDSDGDGSPELVIWSSSLAGPVAFSVTGGGGADTIALERRETFWLPWAGPPGDARYTPGTNYMTTPSFPDVPPFYGWRSADLDGDGTTESVLVEASGSTTVRDSSMAVLSAFEGEGSPFELADMNGDGRSEIISSSPGACEGVDHVAFCNWSGGERSEVWRISGIPGNITYLAAGLLDGDASPDLVAVLRADPRAKESYILLLLTSAGRKADR